MNKKRIITIIIIVFLAVSIIYLLHYHPAQSEATKYLEGSENVSVKKTDSPFFDITLHNYDLQFTFFQVRFRNLLRTGSVWL